MNHVAQITQQELEELIAQKLSADGFKVTPLNYTIEFVTSADGKTSALVSGVVKDVELENVQEPVPPNLERSTRVALQVALTFKPQTQLRLQEKVLESLERDGMKVAPNAINGIVITALQEWAQGGKVVYVDEIDAWHKERAPKSTAAQAAADVLGGSGGVMDRSDGLGAAVASDKRRGRR
jgi:hypothetical protein